MADGMGGGSAGAIGSVDEHINAVAGLSRSLLSDMRSALEQIGDINRSTRIIAMNARVEAARVGRVGASFAVISDEMARLAASVSDVARALEAKARRNGESMDNSIRQLSSDVRQVRLCELALSNIDLIDRNLYERSCDVRWWATDAAVVTAAQSGRDSDRDYASLRLGQILDSYTVYFDLVVADLEGNVLANGRPQQYRSVGLNVAGAEWFRSAIATRDGSQFGFQSAHDCELVSGERSLIYSCAIRDKGNVHGRPVGVLGVVFNWKALAQTIIRRTPLSPGEWSQSRVCIVDDAGLILADSDERAIGARLAFDGMAALFEKSRAAINIAFNGKHSCIAHAASPGYETYRTGWHSLILQATG